MSTSTGTRAPRTGPLAPSPAAAAATVAAARRAPGSVLSPAADDGSVTAAVVNAAATAAAAAASHAAAELKGILDGATGAASAVIVARYGEGITRQTVTVAHRVALTLAGDPKAPTKGEARSSVIRALKYIGDSTPTAAVLVSAAASSAADLNAANKARADRKKTLAAALQSNDVPLSARMEALTELDALQSEDDAAARGKAIAAFESAAIRAVKTIGPGASVEILSAVVKSYAAAVAAAVAADAAAADAVKAAE